MDYFLLKQLSIIPVYSKQISEEQEATICQTKHISSLLSFDYLEEEQLISDRLKVLLEQLTISVQWKPFIFLDSSSNQQAMFWHFTPVSLQPKELDYFIDGFVCHFTLDYLEGRHIPPIFQIKSKKGTISNIVHLSVAESILRRGYTGLQLLRLS